MSDDPDPSEAGPPAVTDDAGPTDEQPAEAAPAAERPAAAQSDEEPTADAVEEYTTSVRTLDARVRGMWMLRAVVFGLVVGVVLTGITFVLTPPFFWVGAAIGLLVVLLGVVHAHLLYRSWEYHIRADSMYLDRGVLTKVQTVVPYVRVQHIDTSRGPLDRAFGLSSLVVYTAGSRGADVTIPGLTPEEATDLQTRLKALAIESEGEDAV